MLSGHLDRRRRALVLSAVASAVLHVIFLAIFFAAVRDVIVQGTKEKVSQTQIVTIERVIPTPPPRQSRAAKPVHQVASAPAAAPPRHELVKEVASAPPEPVAHPPVPSRVSRDQSAFAKEVAQLNKQDDPHAIPTIDPGAREGSSKSYAFSPARSGGSEGNGIITPTQSWHDRGRDCYYARYEYTYPDGAEESGDIAWPFCFDPDSDPFKLPPHPMPFPLPMAGYELPPDESLPAYEKRVYEEWAAANAPRSSP